MKKGNQEWWEKELKEIIDAYENMHLSAFEDGRDDCVYVLTDFIKKIIAKECGKKE